jgi:hypothetical protein
MKKLLFPLFLLLPSASLAVTVFDGYEEYYSTLPDRLFQEEGEELGLLLLSEEVDGKEKFVEKFYRWEGTYAGQEHKVEINDDMESDDEPGSRVLKIDGKTVEAGSIKIFPGEELNYSALTFPGTLVYFSKDWACVENQSHEHVASRTNYVYLINLNGDKKPQAYLLPTLFASCTAIQMLKGQVLFSKAGYRHRKGDESPFGVTFKEYAIVKGKFIPTKRIRNVTFTQPRNVYEFTVDKEQRGSKHGADYKQGKRAETTVKGAISEKAPEK